jgi:hypothetical protein
VSCRDGICAHGASNSYRVKMPRPPLFKNIKSGRNRLAAAVHIMAKPLATCSHVLVSFEQRLITTPKLSLCVNKHRALKRALLVASFMLVSWLTFRPWRWKYYVSSKRRWTFTRLRHKTVSTLQYKGIQNEYKGTENERHKTTTKPSESTAGSGAGRGCVCCPLSDDSCRFQMRTAAMIDDVLRKVTAADCNI